MGLLDYYRQFEDMDQEEVNRGLRERRRREKELALEIVPVLDLSGTEWPDFPNAEVVNASIFAARGRVNGYPDRHATRLRRMLGERHGVEPEQIVVGNGAAELLQTTAHVLLSPGDELVMPWPSYPLFPLMASRAGARPVAVDRPDAETILAAVTDQTRAVVLCNPNDPTGTYIGSEELRSLLSSLPDEVHVLLDEALIHFQDAEDVDACLQLVNDFPRLLVVRTFSKIYGLSGLRAGYAISSDAHLLAATAPVLGINALTQAAVEYALRSGDGEIERRRRAVARERQVLTERLRELGVDVTESQANFLWIRVRELSGDQLASALRKQGVIVAPGGPLGEDHHIRAAIRNEAASNRLLRAIENAL
jgi:histidinol-phosphate aminotransferase